MHEPTLLTVILNYRTAQMTLEAISFALREMRGIAGAINVVDNESCDGSFEMLTAEVEAAGWHQAGRVRVIAAGRNGGYGAGNNVGIRAGLPGGGTPDYVYVLNSDAFPDAGAIHALLDYLEAHPRAGFAGSYIHGPDGEPHHSAFHFPSALGEFEAAARFGPISRLLKRHIVAMPLPEATRQVDWLAGASVMMRRTVLDAIGLFDERFFLYFEETDLCRRAAAAGWPTIYVRESSVTHLGSVSTGAGNWRRTPQYWFDSRIHYFVKNHGAVYAGLSTLAHVAGGSIWRVRRMLTRQAPCDPPHFLRDLATHALRSGASGLRRLPVPGLADRAQPVSGQTPSPAQRSDP